MAPIIGALTTRLLLPLLLLLAAAVLPAPAPAAAAPAAHWQHQQLALAALARHLNATAGAALHAALTPALAFAAPPAGSLPRGGAAVLTLPEHATVSCRTLERGLGPAGAPALGTAAAPPLLSAAAARASAQRLRALWRLFPAANAEAACGSVGGGGQRQRQLRPCLGGTSERWHASGDLWALTVWLMRERALGALGASEWAPYLATLPRATPRLPFVWSPAELALLQDPQAEALAAEARESVRAVYEGFAPTLAAVFQELAAPVLAAAGASAVEEVSVPAGGSGGGSGSGSISSSSSSSSSSRGGGAFPWPMLALQVPLGGPPPEALRQASKGSHASLLFEANAAWVAGELNLTLAVARRALAHATSHHAPRRASRSASALEDSASTPASHLLGGTLNDGFRLLSASQPSDSPDLGLECGSSGVGAGGGLPAFQCSHDSLASFAWALSTVLTHAVVVEGRLSLVPLVGGQASAASYSAGERGVRLASGSAASGAAAAAAPAEVHVNAVLEPAAPAPAPGQHLLLDLFPLDSAFSHYPDVHSHAHLLPLGGFAGLNLSLGLPVLLDPQAAPASHLSSSSLPLLPREPQASSTCWRIALPGLAEAAPGAATVAAAGTDSAFPLAAFARLPASPAPGGAAPRPPTAALTRARSAIAAALGLSYEVASASACAGAEEPKALAWLALLQMGPAQAEACAAEVAVAAAAAAAARSGSSSSSSSNSSSAPPCAQVLLAQGEAEGRALWVAALQHTLQALPLGATTYAEDVALLAGLRSLAAESTSGSHLPAPGKGRADKSALQQALQAWDGENATTSSSSSSSSSSSDGLAAASPLQAQWWETFACPAPASSALATLAAIVQGAAGPAAAPRRLAALLHSVGLLQACSLLHHERRQQRLATPAQRRRNSPLPPTYAPPTTAALQAAAAAVAHRALHKGVLWATLLQWQALARPASPAAADAPLLPPAPPPNPHAPVPLGKALLLPRSADLYLTEEAYEALLARCRVFNAWWAAAAAPAQAGAVQLEALPSEEGGALAPKVLAQPRPGGSGGGSAQAPAAPALTLHVPGAVILGAHTALACPLLGPALAQLAASVGGAREEFQELLTHLLVESARGVGGVAPAAAAATAAAAAAAPSRWAPYLGLLPPPHHLPVPLLYTRAELALLAGSPVLIHALRQRADVAREYSAVRGLLYQRHPSIFGAAAWGGGAAANSSSSSTSRRSSTTALADAFSFPRYAWAHATLKARAVYVLEEGEGGGEEGEPAGGHPLLLPMLDLLPSAAGAPLVTVAPGGLAQGGVLARLPDPARPPEAAAAAAAAAASTAAAFLRTGAVEVAQLRSPADCAEVHLPLPSHLRAPLRAVALEALQEALEVQAAALQGSEPCDATLCTAAAAEAASAGSSSDSGSGSGSGAPCCSASDLLQGLPSAAELEYMFLWGAGDGVVGTCEAAGEEGPPGGGRALSSGSARLEATRWWWQEVLQGPGWEVGEGALGAAPPAAAAAGGAEAGAEAGAGAEAEAAVDDLWGLALRELARGAARGAGARAPCALCRLLEASRLPLQVQRKPTYPLLSEVFLEAHLASLRARPHSDSLLAQLEELLPLVSRATGAHVACLAQPAGAAGGAAGAGAGTAEETLRYLRSAYSVSAVGARLLLAGAARARLRAYPTSLAADLAALVADAAAGVVLALEVEEDAARSVRELLGGSGARDAGQAPCSAAAGAAGGARGSYFGCLEWGHYESALRRMGVEEARAALLPPRARAVRLLLVAEKRLLAAWAGWARGAEGAEGTGSFWED